jgi:hypothetical protein
MQRIFISLMIGAALLVLGGIHHIAAADAPVVTVTPVGAPNAGLQVQWTATGKIGLPDAQTGEIQGWVFIFREALATDWQSYKNQGSLIDTAVQQGQTYRYRACVDFISPPSETCSDWISAQASNGGSAGGTISSSLVAIPAGSSALPTNVQATNITSTGATITWQAIQGESTYEITYDEINADFSPIYGESFTRGSTAGTNLSTYRCYIAPLCPIEGPNVGAVSFRRVAANPPESKQHFLDLLISNSRRDAGRRPCPCILLRPGRSIPDPKVWRFRFTVIAEENDFIPSGIK